MGTYKKSLILIALFLFSITLTGQSEIDFCKKWYLDGYIYWGITYSPDTIEKNDYIKFKTDNTFTSLNEGKLENGIWKWNSENKSIYLYENNSSDKLRLRFIKLKNNILVLQLKDEKGSIKIKYKLNE